MKKKIFQINIEKNGPIIAGHEMESCPRQCTVCPDARKFSQTRYSLAFGLGILALIIAVVKFPVK